MTGRRTRTAALVLLALLTAAIGCRQIGQLGVLFAGRQWQKAHFKPTENRIAIIIDGMRGGEDHPMFRRGLHEKVVELLEEEDVNHNIVPYVEQLELATREPDYANWSIQRIGRELDAEQVIYVQIVSFTLRETPNHPVLTPEATVSVKAIDVEAEPRMARLWPDSVEGYELDAKRQAREATSTAVIDAEAEKLGKDLGQYVARLFYKWDTEETVPRER